MSVIITLIIYKNGSHPRAVIALHILVFLIYLCRFFFFFFRFFCKTTHAVSAILTLSVLNKDKGENNEVSNVLVWNTAKKYGT